jgi:two-component system OmpR family response regulator
MWILVVEDEPRMADVLMQGLEEANHRVGIAHDGHEALAALATTCFDAVIMDVMIPGPSGFEVVRKVRAAGNDVPVLMLTARDEEADIVMGLDVGADDYLVKPFAFRILLARLRAIARRSTGPGATCLQSGDLQLDPASREVSRAGRPIHLTATEFRFLEFLMRRAGRASSRSAIIEAIWGFDEDVEPNTVDTYVKLLRDKIDVDQDRKLIHTIRGYGYILRDA